MKIVLRIQSTVDLSLVLLSNVEYRPLSNTFESFCKLQVMI